MLVNRSLHYFNNYFQRLFKLHKLHYLKILKKLMNNTTNYIKV